MLPPIATHKLDTNLVLLLDGMHPCKYMRVVDLCKVLFVLTLGQACVVRLLVLT